MAIIRHSTPEAPAGLARDDKAPIEPVADAASPPAMAPVTSLSTPPDGASDEDTPATGAAPDATPEATTEAAPEASPKAAPEAAAPAPPAGPVYPQPKLRLEIRDLAHPGSDIFLGASNAATVLAAAVIDVQRLLYGQEKGKGSKGKGGRWKPDHATHVPPTRSVTVILRDMPGVAYTTGSELDDAHKEIHVSLPYLANHISPPTPARRAAEIAGVLTHELVHCYQWNGLGSCPGGLVEGIADWVRLHCRLAPPHWKREPTAGGIRWDSGYQHTAYFLEYLERRFGAGTVRRINERLRKDHYDAAAFWPDLLGQPVDTLWDDYVDAVKNELPEASDAPAPATAKRRLRWGKKGKKTKNGSQTSEPEATTGAGASADAPSSLHATASYDA